MDTLIRFSCPRCGKALKAPPEYAGRTVRCARPTCGQRLEVPEPLPEEDLPDFPPPEPRRQAATKRTGRTPTPAAAPRRRRVPAGVWEGLAAVAILLLMAGGLYWWLWLPSSAEKTAYTNFLRVGNELADMHEALKGRTVDKDAIAKLHDKAQEHLDAWNRIQSLSERKRKALDEKFEPELNRLRARLFGLVEDYMQSKLPVVVVWGIQSQGGQTTGLFSEKEGTGVVFSLGGPPPDGGSPPVAPDEPPAPPITKEDSTGVPRDRKVPSSPPGKRGSETASGRPRLLAVPGAQSAPVLADLAITSATSSPIAVGFSVRVRPGKAAVDLGKRSGLWFCFGKPSTIPSMRDHLQKQILDRKPSLADPKNVIYLGDMSGPGFVAGPCGAVKPSATDPAVWTGNIDPGLKVQDGMVEIRSIFGPESLKATAVPVSLIAWDDDYKVSNELKAVVDLTTGKLVEVAAEKAPQPAPSSAKFADFQGKWVDSTRHDGGNLILVLTIDDAGKVSYLRTFLKDSRVEGDALDRSARLERSGDEFTVKLLDSTYRCRIQNDRIEMTRTAGSGPESWSFGRSKD